MTLSSRRLVFSVLAVTVIVGFSVSLLGCANLGPVTPIAVSDVKSVIGTWEGIVYLPGSERADVTLTIRDEGFVRRRVEENPRGVARKGSHRHQ